MIELPLRPLVFPSDAMITRRLTSDDVYHGRMAVAKSDVSSTSVLLAEARDSCCVINFCKQSGTGGTSTSTQHFTSTSSKGSLRIL